MRLFRPVSPVDALFLAAVALLVGATVGLLVGRHRVATRVGVPAWALFTVFWVTVAVGYLLDARYFLGSIGVVTVVVSGYAGVLLARGRREGERVTVAFTVMGLLFVPYEWVEPIHRLAIDAVAAGTALGLRAVGFSPILLSGPDGYTNVVAFPGMPLSHSIGIVSACSGISAIALFVGLIAATDASPRRRLVAGAGIAALVYALNLIRTTFVAGALAGEWFGFAAGPVDAVYGVTSPPLVSYYVAEYVIAQVLVVVVLLGVYAAFVRCFPELQDLVEGLIGAFRTDVRRLAQR